MLLIKQGVVALIVVTLISACSEKKTQEELIVDAKNYIAQNELSHAEISLKKIIKLTPKHSQARHMLASIYMTMERNDSAEKELLKAIEYGGNKGELELELARLYIKVGKNEQAIRLLDAIDYKDESSHLLSQILRGKAHLNLNEPENAKDAFDIANGINRDSSYSMYGTAIKLTIDKNFQDAESMLQEVLNQDNTFAEAWLLKARFAERKRNFPDAIKAYTSFLTLRPQAHSIKLLLANNYLQNSQLTESETIIDKLLTLNPNNPTTLLLKARVALERKQYTAVGENAELALNSIPNNALALYLSGLSHFYLENYQQSFNKLVKATAKMPEDHPSHRFFILTLFKLGYIEQLTETIKGYSGFLPQESELISSLAAKLASDNHTEASLTLFEKALEIQPNNKQIQAQMGMLKLLNNDVHGIDDLKMAVDNNDLSNKASIALASTYLLNNEFVKAESIVDQWLDNHPDDMEAMQLKVRIFNAQNKPEKGLTLLLKLDKALPNDLEINKALAQQYFTLRDYKKCISTIEEYILQKEDSKHVYELLFRASRAANQQDNIIEKLEGIASTESSLIWPRIILAQQVLIRRDANAALRWLLPIKNTPNLPTDYFATLLNTHFLLNDKQMLNKVSKQWQMQAPENAQSYSIQMTLLARLGDYDQALEITKLARLQKRLNKQPEFILAHLNYALRSGKSDNLDSLVELIEQTIPNNSYALQLMGIHAYMQQHFAIAKRKLESSLNTTYKTSTIVWLSRAIEKSDNALAAVSFLESSNQGQGYRPEVKARLSELYIVTHPEKAEEYFRAKLKDFPNDAVSHNNLAVVLIERGEMDTAILHAKKAQIEMPMNPEVLDTLGVALLKNKQYKEALSVLSDAYQLSKVEMIKMHYAQALIFNQQNEQAETLLSELSQENQERFKMEIQTL